jgi:hypothetical protein
MRAVPVVGQFEKNRPPGAKAPRFLIGIYGTTEVVPFHDGFKLTH